MLYACLLLAAAAADSVYSDNGLSEGKDQMLASPYAQPSVTHFQLGSGAGSDPDFHGNEYHEPAISSGHPRLRSSPVPPTPRESRNVVVTARNLQDIPLNGVFGKLTEVLQASISYLCQPRWRLFHLNISPFYAVLWPTL